MTTAKSFDLSPNITGETPPDPVSGGAAYWIRLTKDLPPAPEKISRAQLARALDNVMGITDHCTGAKSPDAYDPSGEQTAEQYLQDKLSGTGCQGLASSLNVSQNCALDKRLGKPLIKNVYVHCSSDAVRDDYTLRSTGSAIILSGPSPGSRIIRAEIDFGRTSYVPVRYYAEADDVASLWRTRGYAPRWQGPVLQGITRITPPFPHWQTSGTITVGTEVSGKLIVYLPIQFDTWRVSIPGSIVGDKRSYTARFLAASQYLDKPSRITLEDETDADPLANDCSVCGGGFEAYPAGIDPDDILAGSGGDLAVPDDDKPGAYDCDEPVVGCCDGKEVDYIPRCESVFGGFADLEPEVKQQYINRYGEDTLFIGVGPTDPPCGKKILTRSAESCPEVIDARLVFTKIDNWVKVYEDGVQIFVSPNLAATPDGPPNCYYSIGLTPGATVLVEHYNYPGTVQPWCLDYTYRINGSIIDTVSETASTDQSDPVFTRTYQVPNEN